MNEMRFHHGRGNTKIFTSTEKVLEILRKMEVLQTMIDREEAVKRCRDCEYCNPFKGWDNSQYLACSVCSNKWICEVDVCPTTKKE